MHLYHISLISIGHLFYYLKKNDTNSEQYLRKFRSNHHDIYYGSMGTNQKCSTKLSLSLFLKYVTMLIVKIQKIKPKMKCLQDEKLKTNKDRDAIILRHD